MTLPDDVREWPTDALEAYREREAIIIVDGMISHRAALVLAESRVRLEWQRRPDGPASDRPAHRTDADS